MIDAASRDGRSLGPGMNRLQREILEVNVNLSRKLHGDIVAQSLGFFLAVGAFEIAELNQSDLGGGRSKARSVLGLQLVEIFLEGILRQVVNHAANDMLAVLGDIEGLVLGAALVREVNIHLLQIGGAGSLGVVDLHLDLGNDRQKMADISLHVGLVQRGGRRGFGLILRRKNGSERQAKGRENDKAHD